MSLRVIQFTAGAALLGGCKSVNPKCDELRGCIARALFRVLKGDEPFPESSISEPVLIFHEVSDYTHSQGIRSKSYARVHL